MLIHLIFIALKIKIEPTTAFSRRCHWNPDKLAREIAQKNHQICIHAVAHNNFRHNHNIDHHNSIHFNLTMISRLSLAQQKIEVELPECQPHSSMNQIHFSMMSCQKISMFRRKNRQNTGISQISKQVRSMLSSSQAAISDRLDMHQRHKASHIILDHERWKKLESSNRVWHVLVKRAHSWSKLLFRKWNTNTKYWHYEQFRFIHLD